MTAPLQVAIDGPAGVGKTTVGSRLAERLGLPFLDSGLLYRAVTWLAREEGIAADDGISLGRLARESHLRLEPGHDGGQVFVDERVIDQPLHEPAMASILAVISQVPEVRAALLDCQRAAARGGVVMAGRDIGTVVLPAADFKFFLTASPAERERRRRRELEERGEQPSAADLRRDIVDRDRTDSERKVAPLRAAADAITVDTESRTIEQVVREMESLVAARRPAI